MLLFTMSNAGAALSWSDLMDDAWPGSWASGADEVHWGQGFSLLGHAGTGEKSCILPGKDKHCVTDLFSGRQPCVKGVLCPQVMHALRELTGSLSVLMEMVVYCCFCNEHFSFTVLHFIKVHTKPGQACPTSVSHRLWSSCVLCIRTAPQNNQCSLLGCWGLGFLRPSLFKLLNFQM